MQGGGCAGAGAVAEEVESVVDEDCKFRLEMRGRVEGVASGSRERTQSLGPAGPEHFYLVTRGYLLEGREVGGRGGKWARGEAELAVGVEAAGVEVHEAACWRRKRGQACARLGWKIREASRQRTMRLGKDQMTAEEPPLPAHGGPGPQKKKDKADAPCRNAKG